MVARRDSHPTVAGLDTFGHTHAGRRRESNQDSYLSVRFGREGGPAGHLLAVADGMGGHAGGEIASEIAIRTLRQCVLADLRGDGSPARAAVLERAFRAINDLIFRRAERDDLPGMGTTLVAALFCDGGLSVANVGDSRAYKLGTGGLQRITTDHSWERLYAGARGLTPAEIAASPFRGMLTRALGATRELEVDLHELELAPEQYLLLCSDGVYREVSEPDLLRWVIEAREPESVCRRLIAAANEAGGADNITCVVARAFGGSARGGGAGSGDTRKLNVLAPAAAPPDATGQDGPPRAGQTR